MPPFGRPRHHEPIHRRDARATESVHSGAGPPTLDAGALTLDTDPPATDTGRRPQPLPREVFLIFIEFENCLDEHLRMIE
jgi:hypothetical protein